MVIVVYAVTDTSFGQPCPIAGLVIRARLLVGSAVPYCWFIKLCPIAGRFAQIPDSQQYHILVKTGLVTSKFREQSHVLHPIYISYLVIKQRHFPRETV